MVAPAMDSLASDLHITNTVEIQLTLTIFLLGFAFGPLVIAPVSETVGRARVLLVCNMFYIVWNLACGFVSNKAEMYCFRFLAGLGGSSPLVVGGGVLG
jgi:MFS family permease